MRRFATTLLLATTLSLTGCYSTGLGGGPSRNELQRENAQLRSQRKNDQQKIKKQARNLDAYAQMQANNESIIEGRDNIIAIQDSLLGIYRRKVGELQMDNQVLENRRPRVRERVVEKPVYVDRIVQAPGSCPVPEEMPFIRIGEDYYVMRGFDLFCKDRKDCVLLEAILANNPTKNRGYEGSGLPRPRN